jgi:hypothetical protein
MKFRFRSVAALTLAAVLTFPVAAGADPRGSDREDISQRIVRIVKKLQKMLGASTQESLPMPPRP